MQRVFQQQFRHLDVKVELLVLHARNLDSALGRLESRAQVLLLEPLVAEVGSVELSYVASVEISGHCFHTACVNLEHIEVALSVVQFNE